MHNTMRKRSYLTTQIKGWKRILIMNCGRLNYAVFENPFGMQRIIATQFDDDARLRGHTICDRIYKPVAKDPDDGDFNQEETNSIQPDNNSAAGEAMVRILLVLEGMKIFRADHDSILG